MNTTMPIAVSAIITTCLMAQTTLNPIKNLKTQKKAEEKTERDLTKLSGMGKKKQKTPTPKPTPKPDSAKK